MAGCGCDVKFCELETWRLKLLAKWGTVVGRCVGVDLRGGGSGGEHRDVSYLVLDIWL